MIKMVPSAQAGDDNIPYKLLLSCDENTKGICTTATRKNDSFDEKTENASAPSPESGSNNGVKSWEIA